MNKNSAKKRAYVLLGATALAFVLYNVIFFLLGAGIKHGAGYWVSYAFVIASFVIIALASVLAFGKNAEAKENYLRFPIYRHSIAYLMVELLVSTAFMVADGYGFDMWVIPAVVQFVILGLHILALIGTFSAKNTVKEISDRVEDKTNYIRLLKVDVQAVADNATEQSVKKAFIELAEKVRFSDPMSHESLFELEKQILEQVNNAKECVDGGDNEGAIACCEAATRLLNERNMKTKVLKH